MNDDIFILNLIRQGDELAFKSLFDRYFVPLCRFMNIYLQDKKEGEDLALDLFTYLWENRETIQIQISLKAYLFQSARNRCFNALRDKKTYTSLDELELHPEDSLQSTLELEELTELINEAILSLPYKCRYVFIRSRKENKSNKEIAEEMGVSIKTVEGQITKALKRIKSYLGDGYSYLW